MNKQFLHTIIGIFMAIFVNCGVNAQSVSIWDGTSEIWTQGSGTETNPYLIQNAQQLAYIAEMVNGGVTHYENTYFKLTTNLQIDSTTEWQPIGLNETYYFSGNFDGDNHLVTLYLHTSTLQYVGLFGYIQNAEIENLGVGGDVIYDGNTTAYTGGIASYVNNSAILNNCQNTANITGYYVGGIVGYQYVRNVNNTNFHINNCYSAGSLSGRLIGGILGMSNLSSYSASSYGSSALNNKITISNCRNMSSLNITGTIYTGSGTCLYGGIGGGIVGYILCESDNDYSFSGTLTTQTTGFFEINRCENVGNIESDFSGFCGGIVAFIFSNRSSCKDQSSATIYINNSDNLGNITTSSRAAGIVGMCTITSFSSSGSNCNGNYSSMCYVYVRNCYNTGIISASSSSGIIGTSTTTSTTIKNCYNVGSLNGTYSGSGIIGNTNNQTTVTNCHYLNTCGHNTSTPGTAKTEAQMKSSSFPVILNTDSVVFVKDITPNINQGYPVFGSVRTLDADSVGNTTATLHGNYQMLYDVDAHGFEYKKTSESDYTTVNTTGEGNISYALSGLQDGTQYSYRFFVQKDGVYYRGADKTFNTIQCTLSAQITSSSTTLCDGDTVIYTATATSSTPTAYHYVWNTGDSLKAIPVTNGANYTVTVTDAYGCFTTQSKQMTVYPAAVASITGSTVLCNNGSTTLTANGGQYYSWNTGSAQRIITVSQPGIYIATVQTVYGCTAYDTVEVTLFANPTINGNLTFCSGDYTTLTASGGDTYLWNNGATTPSINVNTAGTYSVTASTSNGCSGNVSVSVSENQASEVQISGNTVICSGVGTTLTASTGTTYLWSNGASTQSITANTPGTYTLTVSNAAGCSSTASINVTVMSNVTISGVSSICEGQNTTLSVSDEGNYLWSNGATTSFITVSQAGLYSVTVSLPNGCSSSASTNVTAASNPTPSISGSTTICQGQATILTANGGNSYLWSNGSTNTNVTVSQSGVYTVTATNVEGCSAMASITVTVNPLPEVNITGSNSFCQGDNTTLTAMGASAYTWSNNLSDNTITISNAGTYSVTGTDANGCTSTATQTVMVNPTYNIPLSHSMCQGESYNFYGQNITAAGTYTHTLQTVNGCDSVLTLVVTLEALPTAAITGNPVLCEGESTTLTANGGISYAWSNGSTSSSVSVDQSGVYTVTATNVEGCSATANVTVTVNSLPNITVSGNTTICEGGSTTLTASGAETYSWSTGDNTVSVTISAFGVYTVTGTSASGCSNTASVTVLVSQNPQITITGNTDLCAGESTTLTANGGASYLWNNGSTDATLTVSTAGTYQVIGYNEASCNAMASATVNVWQPVTSEFTIVTDEPCFIWNNEEYCTSGDYNQTLQTVHGCDSVVTLHLTITVGIDNHDGFDFKVYPNPTSNIVNVECTMNNVKFGDMELQLVDAYGRLLDVVGANNHSPLQTAQIDLSRYADGVYFVKVVADDKTIAVRKVVKQ